MSHFLRSSTTHLLHGKINIFQNFYRWFDTIILSPVTSENVPLSLLLEVPLLNGLVISIYEIGGEERLWLRPIKRKSRGFNSSYFSETHWPFIIFTGLWVTLPWDRRKRSFVYRRVYVKRNIILINVVDLYYFCTMVFIKVLYGTSFLFI